MKYNTHGLCMSVPWSHTSFQFERSKTSVREMGIGTLKYCVVQRTMDVGAYGVGVEDCGVGGHM